jgi:leucine dehydrogenase
LKITEINTNTHEKIIHCEDADSGLNCFIAVHNTKLGAALGGTRFWSYNSDEEALQDAVRLSEGMTYKNSLAGLDLGGGKAVINLTGAEKTPDLLRAYGRAVDSLNGMYITAEDVGCKPGDLEIIAETTEHTVNPRLGDPSPATSYGVLKAMEGALMVHKQYPKFNGIKVIVQGLGNVGFGLCEMLQRKGADVYGSDINPSAVQRAADAGVKIVHAARMFDDHYDVYAPCALGATVNEESIAKMKVEIICGSANNQLITPDMGELLRKKSITYVPDYLANAGGVINCYREFGIVATDFHTAAIIDDIYHRTVTCLKDAQRKATSPAVVADEMAEARLKS